MSLLDDCRGALTKLIRLHAQYPYLHVEGAEAVVERARAVLARLESASGDGSEDEPTLTECVRTISHGCSSLAVPSVYRLNETAADVLHRAADRLDALEAERNSLRELLKPFAAMATYYEEEFASDLTPDKYRLSGYDPDSATAADAIRARAALGAAAVQEGGAE